MTVKFFTCFISYSLPLYRVCVCVYMRAMTLCYVTQVRDARCNKSQEKNSV